MPLPFAEIWSAAVRGFAWLPPTRVGDDLVVSANNELHGLAPADGSERWRVVIDPTKGEQTFLYAHGATTITSRHLEPKRFIQVVALRGPQIVWTSSFDAHVFGSGVAVLAGRLYALCNDPTQTSVRLRALDLDSGDRVVDVAVPTGTARLQRAGDALVVVGAAGFGLYRLQRDGGSPEIIEPREAYGHSVSGDRLLATVDCGSGSERTELQARALDDLRILWTAPARGVICAIDGDAAVACEGEGPSWIPVLRDAASGAVRWRGEAMRMSPGTIQLAGGHVFLTYTRGMIAYRRDDGTRVGELELGCSVTQDGERLYFGAFNKVICARR
jgi:hypothetical protein